MYKFPILLPANLHLDLAQGFRADAPVDISHALSVQTTSHLGVDVTCGTSQETWGTPCVWPFPWPGVVYDAQVDAPLGATVHAHSQIDGTDPATGVKYGLVYLHLSAVTRTKTDLDPTVITYQQGDVIGRIGNNGQVLPYPTPARPLDGSHLHLGVGVKKPGDVNYVMSDPLLYFDLNDPFRSAAAAHQFLFNLSFGTRGQENTELQRALQKGGWFPASQGLTDYYGPVTANAVLAFRAAKGVSSASDPKGWSCGPLTRAALNGL